MTEVICPSADICTTACEHGEYHAMARDCFDGCGTFGVGPCITREEVEKIKAVTDAEDKGFMKEVNDGEF